ncbi:MAG TPA: PQQ-binding-like beta-propeller repeat protein [Bryobacteraceae bacterium]|nr:PQQ-binding-like beta-propeller repeat protein [Bryobacteraceae bacterium]
MRSVLLFALMAWALYAQEGATIYKDRYAACHDSPQGRVPALSALQAMSGEAIYLALTSGSMKTQAQGLSTAQIATLIRYLRPAAGTTSASATFAPTCKSAPPFRFDAKSGQWNGWSPNVANSRFQNAASAGLSASDLPRLKLKWAFNLGAVTVARSQPTVVDGRLFITTQTGVVFALDADSGCTFWGFKADGALRSGVTIGEANNTPAAFFTDGGGTVYALDARTGGLIWKSRPAGHPATLATGALRYYRGVIYQPFASYEETLAGNPKYQCCTFRGSIAALDASTGKTLWQTFTVSEVSKPAGETPAGAHESGPSGASIWSSPTIDEQRGVLYVATGDNYSDPPTNTSDAILAMDLKTGQLLWSSQLTRSDAYNDSCGTPQKSNCPEARGHDYDFGQPPILVNLASGKRALVIAQKSGMVHALDPDQKGKILWQTRAGAGGTFGGSQWGSAADEQKIYVAVSDLELRGVADPNSPRGFRLALDPEKGGGLHALDLKTGRIVWSAKPFPCAPARTGCSPAQSAAVTEIPGVVFSGAVDGHLRAYSTATGEVLWDTDTAREFETVNGMAARGGSIDAAGPAVVNGMVFVNSGYGQFGGMPGNVLLAFSVNGS